MYQETQVKNLVKFLVVAKQTTEKLLSDAGFPKKSDKEMTIQIRILVQFLKLAKQATEKLLSDASFPREPDKEITIQNIKEIATENLEIIRGDITTLPIDARVTTTTANPETVNKTTGEQLRAVFSALRRLNMYQARISRTFNSPARYVIYIVESTWQHGTQLEMASLANNYRSCLTIATRKNLKEIAFPEIICSRSQYPIAQAIYIAFKKVLEFLMEQPNQSRFKKVYFVCQDEEVEQIYLDVQKYYLLLSQKLWTVDPTTSPDGLLSLPLDELERFFHILQQFSFMDAILKENQISVAWLQKAADFLKISNLERSNILAKRLGATVATTFDPDVFKLHFNDNFPLNLKTCLLYFPPLDCPVSEIRTRLQDYEMTFQVTIILCWQPQLHFALYPYGENPATLYVVPKNRELTHLLLSPEPVQVFINLLTEQLKITQISPYQVSEGINRDIIFFGRERILAQIMNREPTNYLLIGGRQIGKSSILKYIARHYQNHSKIECHYLVLTNSNIQAKLAKLLGLPIKTDLEMLLEELSRVPRGKYRLLLIDEADLFIRREMENGYPTLSHFRSLSGEGHCFFIFAGVWNLYDAAFLDYNSPIKNFGKPEIIGALEKEACQQLATEPMAMLGINYESEKLVAQIVEQTGQRANLIAMVCDELLKNLERYQSVLTQKDVTRALSSQTVRGALMGWRRLTDDDNATRLDRIIICATIETGEFSLTDVMQILDANHYLYTTEHLNQSFARLELAFIIKRDGNKYHYCVPLFQKMLLEQNVQALLEQEFKQ